MSSSRINKSSWSWYIPTETTKYDLSVRVRRLGAKEQPMKKDQMAEQDDEMLPEYDFSKGVQGKYARRFAEGTNLVALSPDVAEVFPDSKSVNEALRLLIKIAHQQVEKPAP